MVGRKPSVQYDLYISGQYLGGIEATENPASRWVEGYQFSYPYQGELREFIVKTLAPTGTPIKVDVELLPGENTT